VHNEKVVWEAVAPNLQAIEIKESASVFRNHILGNKSIPEHWYGGGGDVNRATASEMDAPALKVLSRKQLTIKYIVEDMLRHQIARARNARYLKVNDEDARFTVSTPEMGTKDIAKLSTSLQQIAAALVTAEMQEWLDHDHARKIFASAASFTGVDIDFDEVDKALSEAAKQKGYDDYEARRPEGGPGSSGGKLNLVDGRGE
jgi:hypothetical protein